MLSERDKDWLREKYPSLTVGLDLVHGKIEFIAAYNSETNKFQVLETESASQIGGRVLKVSFEILLRERVDKTHSKLPSLVVKDIPKLADRHVSNDGTACLCSPLEEHDFLDQNFDFQKFFKELVLPFLYGQTFYSLENRWPWPDLAHGVTGLLESYKWIGSREPQSACVSLSKYPVEWKLIRTIIDQPGDIKGHTPCFCPARDHIRRCHPHALEGLRLLRNDVRSKGIPLP